MLWPGTTALISHYRGSFTQAICCAGNSHNSQWLLVYAGKKNQKKNRFYQLLPKVTAIFFCVVFCSCVCRTTLKEAVQTAHKDYSHCSFDGCSCYSGGNVIHTNCFTITPKVIVWSLLQNYWVKLSFLWSCWLILWSTECQKVIRN